MANFGDIIILFVVIALILLGTISFMLFIRRIIINTTPKNESTELNEKLDRIIMLLEKQSK
ncbi:DUF4083 family protein [Viridibacillus arvi]|jgi:Trk-type K+ transport system membrane component|uniref:DNA mismatch repair protein MutT n=1 Tax=Viridibacillus arvi TaxID=263475 RepID=A0A0M0LCI9_9BACL|nr:DUF4083 family protein [Viridibacillus arvi]KOO48804.1 DNA mismatch repair protein MutT [Viridibacillus arvi]